MARRGEREKGEKKREREEKMGCHTEIRKGEDPSHESNKIDKGTKLYIVDESRVSDGIFRMEGETAHHPPGDTF